jgi:hypothetical protein
MLIPLATLLLSAPSPTLHKAAERARNAAIATCHIPADRLVIEQDEGSSLYTVALKGSAPLTTRQLSCFGDRISEGANVALSFGDDDIGAAYDRMRRDSMMANARAHLRSLGLLGRVPRRDRRHETLRAFAIRLERFCRAAPHSVLRVTAGHVQIRDDTTRHPAAPQADRWLCVVHAAIVAGHDPITVPPPALIDLPLAATPSEIQP